MTWENNSIPLVLPTSSGVTLPAEDKLSAREVALTRENERLVDRLTEKEAQIPELYQTLLKTAIRAGRSGKEAAAVVYTAIETLRGLLGSPTVDELTGVAHWYRHKDVFVPIARSCTFRAESYGYSCAYLRADVPTEYRGIAGRGATQGEAYADFVQRACSAQES
jgi:hypothetical protein